MKTLFVGGHHDGERMDVSENDTIPYQITLNYSLGTESYTLHHVDQHLFFAPSSWSADDALFALFHGYHGPSVSDSPGDLIEMQRQEIVRLQSRLDKITDSARREP